MPVSPAARLKRFFRKYLLKQREIYLSKRSDLAAYKIGRWSYGDVHVLRFRVNGNLSIGSFCSFGRNTLILLGGDHQPRNVSTFPFGVLMGGAPEAAHASTRGGITIGNDVWVGMNATILSGVTIGDGAVIGANSLVSRDVPPYAIAAGNPARVVKMRFPPEVIGALLEIQWWTWSDEDIKRAAPLLLSEDIEAFITAAKSVSPDEAGHASSH